MRRWEELRPELDAHGVQIVALCTDTPAKIRAGKKKHGLQAVMLADPDVSVVDELGIRNQGFHSGIPGAAPGLPIPTTVLVDAAAFGLRCLLEEKQSTDRRPQTADRRLES